MVKPLARVVAFFTLSLLLLLGAGALWLKQDVRTLTWAKPWLVGVLNPEGAPYKISFADVSIDWRHLSQFGRFRVDRMVVTLLDGTAFAAMPKVEIALDPLGFLPNRNALNTIIVIAPKLYLTRSAEGAIRMGLNEEGQSLPLTDLIGFFAGDGEQAQTLKLPFRAFAVERASLTLKDEMGGGALSSSPFTLRLAKYGRHDFSGFLAMPFNHNGRRGRLDARLSRSLTGREHLLAISMTKFPVELACQFGACPADMGGSGLMSGKVNVTLDREHRPSGGSLALQAENATFTAPRLFAEPLVFKEGSLFATISDHGNNLMVEHGRFVFEDVAITGRLQLLQFGEKWRLIVNGRTGKLDVRKLYKYWPLVLAPTSREWVTSKLKAGHAASGTLALNITSKMYDANKFPAEAVQATVDARNITAEYLPGFPELKHANGIARFIGDTLKIDATSGAVLSGTKVLSASLACDDLHHPRAPMVARMKLNAPAPDVATFLKLKHFVFDDGWHLDPAVITGSADVDMTLGFDSFSDDPAATGINFDHVTYDITANLKSVAQPDLLGHMNVRNLNGLLKVSNSALQFDGTLGLSPTAELAIALRQDAGGKIGADISGSIPRSEFGVLGIPDQKQLGEGTLKLDARIDLGKDTMRIAKADFDLTDLAMNISELSWSKPRGVPGTLTLNPREEKNHYAIALKARGLSVENATLKLDDANNLVALSLPRVVSDANDFALDYTTTADGYTVNLTGKKLDASVSYEEESENSLLADFPPITLHVDLGEFVLSRAVPLRAVKGNLVCNQQRCTSANITAKAGNGDVKATIDKLAGKRQFKLASTDAGELLKALDVTDRVYDGKFDLTGKYDDSKQPAPFSGRLLITGFTLKNSQILGRLISLASITGVGDALTGTMTFSKLGADIHHLSGIVQVKNGRASGASVGITMEGKVDTTTTNLNIKGVLVPANIINSLFTKIPIIGALAGKEGEGLIAFNYKVDGKYSDPDISVNPLSGLTPGFLRNIFGGSGSSKENAEPVPAYPGDRPAAPAPAKKQATPAKASQPTP